MKKTLIGTLAIVGLAFSSFGQGEVLFVNTAASATQIWTNNTVGGWATTPTGTGRLARYDGTAGSQWYFALFYAANAVSSVNGNVWLDPAWTFTGAYATNTVTAGRLAQSEPNAHNAVVVPTIAAGATAALNIVAWNAVGGSTLASFINAWNSGAAGLWYGYSAVAHVPLGDGVLITDNFIFGALPGQITGFTVAPVPEPTTFALAGLGAAALLIFRRRK